MTTEVALEVRRGLGREPAEPQPPLNGPEDSPPLGPSATPEPGWVARLRRSVRHIRAPTTTMASRTSSHMVMATTCTHLSV